MKTIYVICGWTIILAGLVKAGDLAINGATIPAYILAGVAMILAGFLVTLENGKAMAEPDE